MADRSAPGGPPKVLYIGGTGRTGSTLLAQVLGTVPGWFGAGELTFLWEYGLVSKGRCSCGAPLDTCLRWGPVLARLQADEGFDPAEMVALRRRFRSVHLPILASRTIRERFLDRLGPFPARVQRLYHHLRDATGAEVIIDTSKEPHYSFILQQRTDLDLYFVHLVRDPRAVLHSWQRAKPELGLGGEATMATRGPLVAAAYYDVSNVAAELIWRRSRPSRYAMVRYEDFIAEPAATLSAIGAFVGTAIDPASILTGRRFDPAEQHVAWGNPNRFREGPVTLRADDEWKRAPATAARRVMRVLTAPVSWRYGYGPRGASDTRRVSTALPPDSGRPGQ
jgi:hypothetical protein